MRLKTAINEMLVPNTNTIANYVKMNCEPFLKASRGVKFYRGIPGHALTKFELKKPRDNRKPLSTPQPIHEMLDNYFLEKFGWRARSQGIFMTSSGSQAEDYGKPFMVFPCGPIRFVYSPKIKDLWEDVAVDFITRESNQFKLAFPHLYKKFFSNTYRTIDKEYMAVEAFPEGKPFADKVKEGILSNINGAYTDKNLWKATGTEVMLQCRAYYIVEEEIGEEVYSILSAK